MALVRQCDFCKKEIPQGKMRIYVKGNRVFYFCSRKCEKNWLLGRKPMKVKWIKKRKEN